MKNCEQNTEKSYTGLTYRNGTFNERDELFNYAIDKAC